MSCLLVYTTADTKRSSRQHQKPGQPSETGTARRPEEAGNHQQYSVGEVPPPIFEDSSGVPHSFRSVSSSASDRQGSSENRASWSRLQQRSSSSPLPATTLPTDSQHNRLNEPGSPVMNETLSVIDEHITDFGSTPRHSAVSTAQPDQKAVTADSSSEYSSHVDNRLSYINGHETEDEEDPLPSEEQVRNWDPATVARQLHGLGIDEKHCQIFEEEEIAGDVLLDMDQNFIFMKEFDFGVMGRRLKTWHKVKAFQEEVKGLRQQPPRHSSLPPGASPWGAALLPRIPSVVEERSSLHRSQGSGTTPTRANFGVLSDHSAPSTPPRSSHGLVESPQRPSAASIRHVNQTQRRHSSIDTTTFSPVAQSDTSSPSYLYSHRPKPSFDRSWSYAPALQQQPYNRPSSRGGVTGSFANASTDELRSSQRYSIANGSDSALSLARNDDIDRGYFSQTEADSRKGGRRLRKRASSANQTNQKTGHHSKKPSNAGSGKKHLRGESGESIRDAADHLSAAAKVSQSTSSKGRFGSLGSRKSSGGGGGVPPSPSTDGKSSANNSGFLSRGSSFGREKNLHHNTSSSSAKHSSHNGSGGDKFRRAMGLRAMSDTGGKKIDTSVASSSSVKDPGPLSARTGSTTPSAKSSERLSSDKTPEEISLMRSKTSSTKGGMKSKKDTSAYIQGLEKKSPQEQIIGCDYYGWMRKRSSHLVAAWKPRLFVLRGRRLSYYYALSDTEERGLIDITSHSVLRADNDPLVTLHATLAHSGMSPSLTSHPSPPPPAAAASPNSQGTGAEQSPSSQTSGSRHLGMPFVFKLVPPKSGSSRTVQFTKPTVHYFQVDDISQGRLWMAALMKATIELDLSRPIESTNKQKTISLRHARMTNQRPPALLDPPVNEADEGDESDTKEDESEDKGEGGRDGDGDVGSSGLRIRGLSVEKSSEASEQNDKDKDIPESPTSDTTEDGALNPSSLPEVVAALRAN